MDSQVIGGELPVFVVWIKLISERMNFHDMFKDSREFVCHLQTSTDQLEVLHT